MQNWVAAEILLSSLLSFYYDPSSFIQHSCPLYSEYPSYMLDCFCFDFGSIHYHWEMVSNFVFSLQCLQNHEDLFALIAMFCHVHVEYVSKSMLIKINIPNDFFVIQCTKGFSLVEIWILSWVILQTNCCVNSFLDGGNTWIGYNSQPVSLLCQSDLQLQAQTYKPIMLFSIGCFVKVELI